MRTARIAHRFSLALLAATLVVGARPSAAETSDSDRLIRASEVLVKFTAEDEKSIPAALLERAHGVAVIPSLVRGGFFLGGRRGRGVLSVREADGQWSNPAFITLTGGNIGLQFGAEWADVVLVFENEQSVKNMASGKFTMGGDATAIAGPLGKRATAAITGKAQVYIYAQPRFVPALRSRVLGSTSTRDGDKIFSGDDRAALSRRPPRRLATRGTIDIVHGRSTPAPPSCDDDHHDERSAENSGGSADEAATYLLDDAALTHASDATPVAGVWSLGGALGAGWSEESRNGRGHRRVLDLALRLDVGLGGSTPELDWARRQCDNDPRSSPLPRTEIGRRPLRRHLSRHCAS